jgi:hypothetical protein
MHLKPLEGIAMRLLPVAVLLGLLLAVPARAATVDPSTEQALLALYGRYKAAIVAGKFDAATAVMSAGLKKRYQAQTRTAKERKEALEMARQLMPETVTVVHSFIDDAGTHARLVTLATRTMTVPKGVKLPPGAPPPGTVMKAGVTLEFVKEGGGWKFNEQTFGADPTAVLACNSEVNEPESAYDLESNVSAGGPIVRVEFKPDYTLVVFSVVGDPNCAFLPNRAALEKAGLRTAMLVPYAMISLDGVKHRSDPQKILSDQITVTAEE